MDKPVSLGWKMEILFKTGIMIRHCGLIVMIEDIKILIRVRIVDITEMRINPITVWVTFNHNFFVIVIIVKTIIEHCSIGP